MLMTEGSIYFNIDHIDSHFNLTLKREREGEREHEGDWEKKKVGNGLVRYHTCYYLLFIYVIQKKTISNIIYNVFS